MGRIVNGASIVEPAIRPASGSNNDLAPGRPLEIIPLRQIGCGCSSVVEHLLAKEDVASSSLVTRSSLDALRLFIAVAVSPRTVIHRIDWRPEAASQRAQRRTFPTHSQVSAVDPHCKRRLGRRKKGDRFREVSEIGFRTSVSQTPFPIRNNPAFA